MVMRLDELLMNIWKEKREKAIKVVFQFRIYKIKQKIKEGLRLVRWRTKCFTRIQAIWKGRKVRKWYLRKNEGTKELKKVKKKEIFNSFLFVFQHWLSTIPFPFLFPTIPFSFFPHKLKQQQILNKKKFKNSFYIILYFLVSSQIEKKTLPS